MKYYITTSIPYVNAAPHIGHALEFVQTDAFARYHRLIGDETRFLTGTDENSLKNVQAAEQEGVPTKDLVERYSATYRELTRVLDISNDDFIRTSRDPRHKAGVHRLWQACAAKGDIYRRSYKGLYCVGCEQFYDEEELVGGVCPEHGTQPELVEEENYFFRLSRYGDQLLNLIKSGQLRVIPDARRNEALSFIGRGLQDFSISRSRTRARGWGIEVPGDPEQVIYVWFDALANYITALGYATGDDLYWRFWLENPNRVHIIGKGILRFHAVYWPAMLLSAGEPLPSTIFVHGYLTVEGKKISKSLGNVIDPAALAQRYGTDPVRYWLLREVPSTGDADYSEEKFQRRYTADLANDLGNLLNRTIGMLHRYRQGIIPAAHEADQEDSSGEDLKAQASGVAVRIQQAMERDYDPQGALVAIWEAVGRANRYVEETAPWSLAKAERNGVVDASRRLDTVLYNLAETLRFIAEALRCFLPSTASQIASQLGISLCESAWTQALTWGRLQAGDRVGQAQPIFPRLSH